MMDLALRPVLRTMLMLGCFLPALLSGGFIQAGQVLQLTAQQQEYDLQPVLAVYEDKQGRLGIEQILQPDYQRRFRPLSGSSSRGFTASVYWLRLRLHNRSAGTSRWILEQNFANTHYMDLYVPVGAGQVYRVKKSGNLRPLRYRDLRYRKIVFFVSLPARQERTYFIRLQSAAALSLDLRLWSPRAFFEKVGTEVYWLGGFYGVLLILFGYNLFLFFLLRDKSFLLLASLLGSVALTLSFYDGFAQLFTASWPPYFSRIGIPLFLAASMASLLSFNAQFMPVSAAGRVVQLLGRGLLWLWLAGIAGALLFSYQASVRWMIPLSVLTIGYCLVTMFLCPRMKGAMSTFVYLAWGLFLGGLFAVLTVRLGWMDSSFIAEHGMRFGIVLFALFMSFGLANQVNRARYEGSRISKALRDTEAQRSMALAAGNMGIWSWDIDSNRVFWSAETESIFGLAPGSFPQTFEAYQQYIFPEDSAMLKRKIEQALQSGSRYHVEHRIIRADGEVRWVSGTGRVDYDESGKVLGMTGVVQDITEQKQQQHEREKTEEKYRLLFEHAYDAIIILRAGVIVDCNLSTLKMFGVAAEKMLGLGPEEFSPPQQPGGEDSGPRIRQILQEVSAGRQQQLEWQCRRADGSCFDTEINVSQVTIGGEVLIQAIIRDVTDRKRILGAIQNIAAGVCGETGKRFFEQMVLQLQKLFGARYVFIGLLDTEKNSIFTYSVCAGGKIVDNISYALAGTPCAEVVGKQTCVYADSVQEKFPQDVLLRRMNAESYIGTPLFDSQSRPIGLVAIIDDRKLQETAHFYDTLHIFAARAAAEIERLQIHEQFSDIKQKLSLHIKNTPLGVIEWDTDFRVVEWNHAAEAIFGYSYAEARGRKATELIIPDSMMVIVRRVWQDLLANKGGERSSNQNITKSGKLITCEWYNTPLVTAEGKVIGVASLVDDISERIEAQQELRKNQAHLEELVEARTRELKELNRELEAFSYSISHDLRAPLRSIDGFSRILMEDYYDLLDDTGKDYLQRVCAGSQRMADLIDDLLKLSRVNRASLEIQSVNLSSLVEQSIRQLREYEPHRKVDVVVMPDVWVPGDRKLLAIAIDNLVGNAWKYTGKTAESRIEFSARKHDGETVCLIEDNGVGFNMQYADRLFGAFQRLHSDKEFEGNGIGLATVSRIVRRHGGRIWAEAEPGRGARFYFTVGEQQAASA